MGIPRLLDRFGSACRICQGAGRSHSKGVPLWSPSRPHKTLEFTLVLVWSPSRPHKTLEFTLALVWRDIVAVPANSPDPEEKTNNDLRSLGEALLRISRMLHEHTRKLELAVEGTYAGESGDPLVRLLSDSLRVSRTADLELGRLNQGAQRVLLTLQEQLEQPSQAFPRPPTSQFSPPSASAVSS